MDKPRCSLCGRLARWDVVQRDEDGDLETLYACGSQHLSQLEPGAVRVVRRGDA